MKKYLIILAAILIAHSADAAQFYFAPNAQDDTARPLVVQVLMAPDEPINAVEGAITFDPTVLDPGDLDFSSSVVSLWIEKPHLEGDDQIVFSGIIPGGVSTELSKIANLFTIRFGVLKVAKTQLGFQNVRAFLNQPNSPEDSALTQSLTFPVKVTTQSTNPTLILDFFPPEEFDVYLVKNSEVFSGNSVLVFSAQDKGSGVDHYEINEKFLGLFGQFKRGESPYQLSWRGMWGIINVKAVDKVGRERIETYTPATFKWLLIGLSGLLALLLAWIIYRTFRKINFWKK